LGEIDVRIALLGLGVQTTSAILLAATFLALRRVAVGRGDLRDWSRAFVALSIALITVLVRYRYIPEATAPATRVARVVLDFAYQGGKFAFFAWLLLGACRFAERPLPVRPRLLAAGLLAYAAFIVLYTPVMNRGMLMQTPVAFAACACAAWAMARVPAGHRTFGSRATAVVFALLALLWAFYSVSFALEALQPDSHRVFLVSLARYNSYVDVVLQMSLGFALVITVFQELERRSEVARLERAALQARLAESQKLESLGVLVSGVAHDLNNPLTSILGFADVISSDERMPAEMRQPAKIIAEQALRCSSIVRGLLDAARQRRAPRERLRLSDVVARVARGVAPQLHRARIHVQSDVAPEVAEIVADPTGLEQLFANLFANAIDVLPGGGRIAIAARLAAPGRVAIRFEDDGPGIAPSIRSRIFEPFFTTKGGGRGTGLGLAIVQRIVRTHGGTIHVVEHGGAGACFEIDLPLQPPARADPSDSAVLSLAAYGLAPALPIAAARAEPPREAAPAADATSPPAAPPVAEPAAGVARRACVLVVDDEKTVRELLRRYLGARGFDVVEAPGGREALALLRPSSLRIDAVVTDLRMPGMNGIELFEEIRALHPEIARRTIAITGEALTPDVAQFVRSRACLVLQKPLDLARLVEELTTRTADVTRRPQDRSAASA